MHKGGGNNDKTNSPRCLGRNVSEDVSEAPEGGSRGLGSVHVPKIMNSNPITACLFDIPCTYNKLWKLDCLFKKD